MRRARRREHAVQFLADFVAIRLVRLGLGRIAQIEAQLRGSVAERIA